MNSGTCVLGLCALANVVVPTRREGRKCSTRVRKYLTAEMVEEGKSAGRAASTFLPKDMKARWSSCAVNGPSPGIVEPNGVTDVTFAQRAECSSGRDVRPFYGMAVGLVLVVDSDAYVRSRYKSV